MAKLPPINRRPLRSLRATVITARPVSSAADTSVERARILRATATDAEKILWASLRALKLEGFHFRQQARIGPYFADLACKGARLIVELDGSQHGTERNVAYDEKRTAFLNSRGYRVLRFWNREVFENRDGVLEAILCALRSPPDPRCARLDLPMLGR